MEEERKKKRKKKNIIRLVILGGLILFLIAFKLVVVFQSSEQEASYESTYEVQGEDVVDVVDGEFNLTGMLQGTGLEENIVGMITLFIAIAMGLTLLSAVVSIFSRRRSGFI